eukprot:6027277-Pyramimonas_sp.AAC.7
MPPILPVSNYGVREEKQKQKLASDLTNRDCGFACNMDVNRPFSDELDVFNRLLPLHVFALEEYEAPELTPAHTVTEGEDAGNGRSHAQVNRGSESRRFHSVCFLLARVSAIHRPSEVRLDS